jgi:hypothetical protein
VAKIDKQESSEPIEPNESIEPVESNEPKESNEPIETTKLGDVSSVASDIINQAPDVQQHAIDKRADQQQRNIDANPTGLVDRHGDAFDKDRHKSDSEGKPVLTASGKLSLKSGRRAGATGSAQKSKVSTGPTASPAAIEDAAKIQKMRASGKGFANMFLTLGVGVGGDEWAPTKTPEYDERTMLETCFADYFEATGKDDLPPSMALAAGMAAYALPRFQMPNTKLKAKTIAERIALWWVMRRNNKAQKKIDAQETKPEDKGAE